ncbi:hypothetical protein K504DRAFT_461311 [Pleomassaria siparia CBS 279.74]|uniref:Uncharacterized protein n=1 Tax=Pleomassaria siparia CBS 279.74 TaxID=1314801 RepID=A0A6G1JVH8_9PLEO|nr:hypothetical protein K504DRAFT_461311 [Pleomassaria siparia CBS 279.74]
MYAPDLLCFALLCFALLCFALLVRTGGLASRKWVMDLGMEGSAELLGQCRSWGYEYVSVTGTSWRV